MSFNRFTGLWFPLIHKKIWHHKWYIYATLGLSLLSVSNRFTADGYFRVRPDGSVYAGYSDLEFEALCAQITAFFLGISTGMTLIFSILTIYKYKKVQDSMIPVDKSIELIIYTIILLFVQCLRFAYNRLRVYFVYDRVITVYIVTAYPYISLLHVLVASVGIMILSTKTREIYLNFYFLPFVPLFKKYLPKMSQNGGTQVIPF
uniref:Serpentine receptor class gamma n=1 Tax=Panagrolaimus sp. PS1159 TaxID=55785 RepID=A0AC35F387_9BILA